MKPLARRFEVAFIAAGIERAEQHRSSFSEVQRHCITVGR